MQILSYYHFRTILKKSKITIKEARRIENFEFYKSYNRVDLLFCIILPSILRCLTDVYIN
jgi:hypothetical protein